MAQKLRMGYEVVKDNDPEKLALTDSTPLKAGEQLDTTQRFADLVLARIPVEAYEKIVARNRTAIRRRAAGVANQLKATAGAAYFDATHGDKNTSYQGRVTEKQFNETKGK